MRFTQNVVVLHGNLPNIPPTGIWKLAKCYFHIFPINIYSPVSFSMTHRNTTIMRHFTVSPIQNGGRKKGVVLELVYSQLTASRQSRNYYSTFSQTLVRVLTVFSIRMSSSSKLKFVSGKALFQSILFNAHLEISIVI